MINNYKDLILDWWKSNFPSDSLSEIKELSGGQSNQCFLLNSKMVLKIYAPKYEYANQNQDNHFKTGSKYQALLSNSGFTPKIIGIYKDDSILECNAILMEYIEGTDLSKLLYTYSEDMKIESGKLVGKILKTIHQTETIPNQEYNTKVLINEIKAEFEGAKEKNLLYSQVQETTEKMLADYLPRIITDDFVLTHGDAHPENFIFTKNGLKIIDLDMCEPNLRSVEMRMILHTACMPANLVSIDLEQYYPDGSLVEWFKGILTEYPELCSERYLPEIKLIVLLEILNKFNLPETVSNKDTPRQRAMSMYRMVFEENLLENSIVKSI